jgi:NAD(P)H-nitrite reductase large subunit
MTRAKKYVILGASAAGLNAAAALRSRDPEGDIILVSEDKFIYSRCILHHYIAGIRDIQDLEFKEAGFMEQRRIHWKAGVRAQTLNTVAKTVSLTDGTTVGYDKLLIATGASTAFPPIPGLTETLSGLYGLRTLEDAVAIKSAASRARHIAVLGAGLIGIDAVEGLLEFKRPITLVELAPRMLSIQLDETAAAVYQEAFAARGVRQIYGVGAKCLLRDASGALTGILLSTGETISCDMLVCATGVRSNVQFLQDCGIALDKRGLVFDTRGQTSDPAVYGAGDVSGKTPVWPMAVKEGIVAGINMAGGDAGMDDFFVSKATMNFLGIPSLSLGMHTAADESFVTVTAREGNNYKKVIHRDGKIYGAVIQGDISYAGVLTRLIRARIDISRITKPLYAVDYSDFFNQTGDLEFTFDEQ